MSGWCNTFSAMVSACLASFGSTFASNVLIPPTQIGAAQSQECRSHLGQRRDQEAYAGDDHDEGKDRIEVFEGHEAWVLRVRRKGVCTVTLPWVSTVITANGA